MPKLKSEHPWFKSVHSQVLQETLKRLDKAFKAFFKKNSEFPQFHNFPKDGSLKVSKIGNLRITTHREIPADAKIKTLTITKEAGKWFACFSTELDVQAELKQDLQKSIGIDLGTKYLYTPNVGNRKPVPKYLRKAEERLVKLQRRYSKTKKRSPERYKIVKALQKVHFRVRCKRLDFLHKEANRLLKCADHIFVEDLEIKRMMARPKPILGEDGEFLSNKAKKKSILYNKPYCRFRLGYFSKYSEVQS